MLMIVSVCLPMIGALDAPTELRDSTSRETPPSPCMGPDACRGYDASNTSTAGMNLTADFSFASGSETNSYWGEMNATSSYPGSWFNDTNVDYYIVDMDPGFGLDVTVSWNNSNSYAYIISFGEVGGHETYSDGWAWDYVGGSGSLALSTVDGNQAEGGGTSGGNYATFPLDVGNEQVAIRVWCYQCYNSNDYDYQMNITIWSGDGGLPGDTTSSQTMNLLDMPDEPASWSYQSGTFELGPDEHADLIVTFCDVWCTPETSIDVTKPDGSIDTFTLPDYYTGTLATYNDSGSYLVEKHDTYGDGGMGLKVGRVVGNFSGLLSVDSYNFEDSAGGFVDSTDTSDVYAVWVPENYKANLTLHWDNSADLDLKVYNEFDMDTNSPLGMFAFSYFSQPEFVDLGQLGIAQLVFAEVVHYSGPASGYSLEYQTEPGSPPPCFFQDDGAEPGMSSPNTEGDATEGSYTPDDDPTDVTHLASENYDGTWSGVFTGTMCSGYDAADWYQISVPAGYGAWASLEWPEGVDSNFDVNQTIEGDISFAMYMVTSYGSTSFVSSSYGFHPQAVATNESYSWNGDISSDSVVYLRLLLNDMNEDYESNYTVAFELFNGTEEPEDSLNQNDAGQGMDAGDSSADPMNLTTSNMTFEGYGHDSFDMYDYYKIFLPPSYAMEVCVSFPEQNDIDLNLYYINPTYGWLSFIDSSYNDNPECVLANFDDNDQDIYIRVWTDRGSGDYEVSINMLNPGMAPGDNQDDCGMAGSAPSGDAADLVYPGSWSGHTFTNESTQADLNPRDSSGAVRQYWEGGACTGWLDSTWDAYDMYSIAVPEGHYIQIDYDIDMDDEYDMNNHFWAVQLLMCQVQHQPCSGTNLAYYMQYDSGYGLDEGTLISGLWPVGTFHNASGCDTPDPNDACAANGWDATNAVADTPGWAYLYVYNSLYSGMDNHTYELNISFHPLTELEGGNQNDANSGGDAGPGAATAVMVNDHMNQTQMETLNNTNTLEWLGWSHGQVDITDLFLFEVPANYGFEIEWTCDNVTNGGEDCDGYHFMYGWDSSFNDFYIGAAAFSGSFTYNTSNYASSTDSFFGVSVHNWYGYDEDGEGYSINVTFFTLDADGDGWLDQLEVDCGTDPYDANSTPADTDGDGICDAIDDDIDGDGVGNDLDEMPMDENGTSDMDGDGLADDVDPDVDGDNWTNIEEQICLGAASMAHLDGNISPTDYDGDGLCDIVSTSDTEHASASNYLDYDGDNDGTDDVDDAFDFDECADTDTDRDDMPDSIVPDCSTDLVEDMDDDGDGHDDAYEISCLSDPLLAMDMPLDSDSDDICDVLDPDDDNDGVNDTEDWDSLDSTEWADSDGDGLGDNRDMDDDNDGWWDTCDSQAWEDAQAIVQIEGNNYFPSTDDGIASNCPGQTDAFPDDSTEWIDTDGDGTGDNADADDDGDGWLDSEEVTCGSDPLNAAEYSATDSPPGQPLDADSDGLCDAVTDTDDDGDGIPDFDDAFPTDDSESSDSDGDGMGDELDDDDDNDGWTDQEELDCLTDPLDTMSVPSDNDRDDECDLVDGDDDNDGVIDIDDAFPNNPLEKEDSDGDGTGDNADNDDDGDGWLDAQEVACANAGGSGDKDVASETPVDLDGDGTCDAIDPDDDNDGFPDPQCVNTGIGTASKLTYVECAVGDEDRFPRDANEWYDANEDGLGDQANPITLIDKVSYDPLPYVGIVGAIAAAGYGLLQMSQRAGSSDEDEAEDYTEEFEDYDFEEDDDEGQED